MIELNERIEVLATLGDYLAKSIDNIEGESNNSDFKELLLKAEAHNAWFTQEFLSLAINNIVKMLDKDALTKWVSNYNASYFKDSDIRVGVVMAGNIPLVGFHDFLSVIISGRVFIGKLSSGDQFLLPYLAKRLVDIDKRFQSKIFFEEHLLKDFDAVIATGSNNSSRYFDFYFGKYPNIIRHNRNSVALLSGEETKEELRLLAKDIFSYFGLGCRNVSKLMLPRNYDIPSLLDEFQSFDYLSMHNKYFNNYEYNKSLLLINKEAHFDNGFLLLKENPALSTPVSVLHYEFYDDKEDEIERLNRANEQIQCVLSTEKGLQNGVLLGESQSPTLMQYADNVDIMEFLLKLEK